MRHVVQFSGGAGSYGAAHRVTQRHGPANTTLLCADTLSEADDWNQFIHSAADTLGAELVVVTNKNRLDLWDLAFQEKAIPSPRLAFCSRMLKREPLRKWLDENCVPADTTLHFGFDWTEQHRLQAVEAAWPGWGVDAPMLWDPPMSKTDALELIASTEGLATPAAYSTGMPHNNCLKYGCVKGGIKYWGNLLRRNPEAFARSEERENTFREQTGRNVSILKNRVGGVGKPFPLNVLRERIESQTALFDDDDWGSCSCMTD